jgi:hypothetical protein
MIASAGNRNPANADRGGDQTREDAERFTAQACLDLPIGQRNGAGSFGQQWGEPLHPSVDRHVVDLGPAFRIAASGSLPIMTITDGAQAAGLLAQEWVPVPLLPGTCRQLGCWEDGGHTLR